MSVLCDHSLEQVMEILVGHTDKSLINPASIDIRIGETGLIEHPSPVQPKWKPINLQEQYDLPPGAVMLVSTMEKIAIPNGYVGAIFLKSSRAREGYDHALAGWIDPGWDGIITLEITNNLRYHSIPVYEGLKIAQLVVMDTDMHSRTPYRGEYKGSEKVRASKYETRPTGCAG